MATHLADTTVLNNGIKMPWLGLGVWKVKEGDEVQRAILSAIETGLPRHRHRCCLRQ